ncbi:MAG TPA: PP2C family protein-serine/threonine phosphatase [Bacteroidota bacterium]
MDQHKLYRTIKLLGEEQFRTDEQMLGYVLEKIIDNEEIPVKGGRIWKLEPATSTYRLIHQVGDVQLISRNFRLRVAEYPLFRQLHKRGTLVGSETNKYLRQKGIVHYSATGVGEKVQADGATLFQYVLAINADYLKEDMVYALNIIGAALTSALLSRRSATKAKLLEADLDKARAIQQSILPAHELKFGVYDLYGVSVPERVVGGDFFDYLQAKEDRDRLAVVVGDAASKGLSAAAQALYVSGALRMGVEYQTKLSTLLDRINELVNRTFSTEHFISMFYAEFTNSGNGLVFYANAGHSNPILLHADSDQAERLGATGQLLGPFPNEKYRTEYAVMKPGDVLLLYTDGIVEAANERQEMFGEHRLIHLMRENRRCTPKEICQAILQEVQTHNRLVEYSDDKTLVAIKRSR